MTHRPTDEVLAAVLHDHPDVAAHLRAAHAAAWRVVDPVLLELCRLRIAMLLGCEAELAARTPAAVERGLDEATVAELAQWPTSPRFGPRERACLALCEQFVMDVAGVTDELAADVSAHLGPAGPRRPRGGPARGGAAPAAAAGLVGAARAGCRVSRSARVPAGTRSAPELLGALRGLAAAVVRLGGLDPVTTELVRLRCARHHDCHT